MSASDSHPAGGIPGFLVRLFSIYHLCTPRSMQRAFVEAKELSCFWLDAQYWIEFCFIHQGGNTDLSSVLYHHVLPF